MGKETGTEGRKFTKVEWTNLYELAIEALEKLHEVGASLKFETLMFEGLRPVNRTEHNAAIPLGSGSRRIEK